MSRIPFTVQKGTFSEIEKMIKLSSHVHIRAGVFPFWQDNGKINVILGRDTRTRLYTNLAGHADLTNKTLFDEMNRECKEESLKLLSLNESKLSGAETYFSVSGIISFYEISKEEAKELLEKFTEKVKTCESPEIDKLETMTWENFWQVVHNNNKNELMFRPISFILSRIDKKKCISKG